jgi:hypothetical protein
MAHALTVVALFGRDEDAKQAVSSVVEAGFPAEHVGYLEPTDVQELKNSAKGAEEGIAAGAGSGAVIGGILGAVAVALIPGVGEALVAGALVPVVMGLVTGASTGAVAGGLLGTAASSEDEPYFMEEIQAGRILVSVEVPDADAEAKAAALLGASQALEVDSLGTAHLHAKLHHPQPDGGEKAKGDGK